MTPMPKISVIVCSFNGASRIDACLTALAAQTISSQIEIIVVDDGSTDETSDIARRFDVQVITHATNLGLSAARNTGVNHAASTYVAFTDDDCIPPPTWAAQLVNAWSRAAPHVVGIGGLVHSRSEDTFNRRYLALNSPLTPTPLTLSESGGFLQRLRAYVTHENVVSSVASDVPVAYLVGANMSFRRESLNLIGGFDSSRTFGGDETYVCRKLRETFDSECLLCVPDISIAHDYAPGFRDSLRRAYAFGKGLGRDYVEDGGTPSLRPLSALVLVLLPTAIFIPTMLVFALLFLPAIVEIRWIRSAFDSRKPERLTYPWLVVCQEMAHNLGFAIGWSKQARHERHTK